MDMLEGTYKSSVNNRFLKCIIFTYKFNENNSKK